MAVRYSLYSLPVVNLNQSSNKGPVNRRLVMCAKNQFSVKIQRISFLKNKVFEDPSAGIICYEDENGEMICEGFDEGPRFHHQLSRFHHNPREDEIIDLLKRCWLHLGDEKEYRNAEKEGVAGQTDFKF